MSSPDENFTSERPSGGVSSSELSPSQQGGDEPSEADRSLGNHSLDHSLEDHSLQDRSPRDQPSRDGFPGDRLSGNRGAAWATGTDVTSSIQSLLGTVVIAVFVITFIVQAFQIPSPSMENTLLVGD